MTNRLDINNQIRYVSHEIRNHLSICDMYSQIIRKNLQNDNIQNQSIENALDCIQQSVQIIGANLLELKAINQETPQNIDFKDIVISSVELSKGCVEDKEIEFEVYIKNSAEICIDKNRFQACIVNIIKNGIQAIDYHGKIIILGEIKNNLAILKISNNGKPIPPDRQKLIFEEGYTTKKEGCGLGLNICKRYLESQKSIIKLVKSNKTETTFEINVPVC